jgi:hypothetical protein
MKSNWYPSTDQLHARDRFSDILGYQLLFIIEGSIATVKYTDQLHARTLKCQRNGP